MKKHNIKSGLFFLLLMIISTVGSSQVKKLSLQEAIDLGVKNSKQLKISKARIDGAAAMVKEAEDNRLPGFSISSSYLRLNSPNVVLKTKSSGGADSGKTANVSQALYGIASVSYPIYAGGKIRYGIESNKYLLEAARLDADNDKEGVILNIMNAYINLYKSKSVIHVLEESLEQSRQRDTDFLKMENNGLLARNDRLKASLQTSNIELSLLDAQNEVKLADINMDLLLGLPENTELEVDISSLHEIGNISTMEEYESMALLNRKDIAALGSRKKAANSSIKIAKAESLPTIALTGGYIAAYVPNLVTVTNAINVGIGVQYNLAGLWKTNTKLLSAKAKLDEINANQEQLNDQVRIAVSRDYQNFLLSQKKTELYQKALGQATENYRITKNKYDNSLVTATDLLDADVAQLQAKLNLEFAKADVFAAYNKLLGTVGVLQ